MTEEKDPIDFNEVKYRDTRRALKELKDQLELVIEYQRIEAKVRWQRYKALLEEGFKEEQALELTKGDLIT